MKKFLMMVCSAAMLLSLVGCGNTNSKSGTSDNGRKEKTTANETTDVSSTEMTNTTANEATDISSTETTNTTVFQEQDTVVTQPEEEMPPVVEEWKPEFESDRLTVYADQFRDDEIKGIYTAMFGDVYVELEDGLYRAEDSDKNNLIDESVMADWGYSQFTGFFYIDHEGYYHFDDGLAHGINGDVFYCFSDMFSGDLLVYSLDQDGYVYCNRFEDTGKKVTDNEKILFSVSVNGEDVLYDQVDSLQVLPAKGKSISSPYILVYIDGIGYVERFSFVFKNELSITGRVFLTDQETYMDYSNNTNFDYVTQGVDDKISYIYNKDEYAINLPDGHTVDEIKYFKRGLESANLSYFDDYNMGYYDILVFDNGDVYFWDEQPSILGEKPIKDEELSQIGANIEDVLFANTEGYYFLMSDGVIYEVQEKCE